MAMIARARYYDQDTAFLLELEPHCTHYAVLVGSGVPELSV